MKEGGAAAAARKGKEKTASLGSNQSGRRRTACFFFPLLLRVRLAAAVTDGLCMRARRRGGRGCLCARAYCRRPHPSAFPGDAARTWEKALAARKAAPCHTEAISAARQPARRSQRDQRQQRKTPPKKREPKEIKCNEE